MRRLVAEGFQSERVQSHSESRPYVLPEYSLVRALVRMDKAGVRQIGVVDGTDEKRLVGLLTMSDIVRSHAQAAVEAGDPDKTVVPELLESDSLKS